MNTKDTLQQIEKHFEELEKLYSSIDYVDRGIIQQMHSEYTVDQCIRWGLQNTGEVLRDFEEEKKKALGY